MFLFNDMLLVTKGDIKKDRYKVTTKLMRGDNARVEAMADSDGTTTAPPPPKAQNLPKPKKTK